MRTPPRARLPPPCLPTPSSPGMCLLSHPLPMDSRTSRQCPTSQLHGLGLTSRTLPPTPLTTSTHTPTPNTPPCPSCTLSCCGTPHILTSPARLPCPPVSYDIAAHYADLGACGLPPLHRTAALPHARLTACLPPPFAVPTTSPTNHHRCPTPPPPAAACATPATPFTHHHPPDA